MQGLTFKIHNHGVDFPTGVSEAVCSVSDGFIICIDRNLPEMEKKHKYHHAMQNIVHNFFERQRVGVFDFYR